MLHTTTADKTADFAPLANRRSIGRSDFGLMSALREDVRKYTPQVALLRLFRKSRIALFGRAWHELAVLAPFCRHVTAIDPADPLFFLSHRTYLARGLNPRKRLLAALAHYRHEATAFNHDYVAQVYEQDGLPLWCETRNSVAYAIRLTPGNDVAHEGGLSIVMTVDQVRVCVLSFSIVPAGLLIRRAALRGAGLTPRSPLIFVTRKHLSRDRSYQGAFHRAFARTTPAHLCMGALAGLAQAEGIGHALGIHPGNHPAFAPKLAAPFSAAYADFWKSFGGRMVSRFGYLIALPLQQPPLDNMDRQKRASARHRRAYMSAVSHCAQAAILPCVIEPGSAARIAD